ncbi:hypothetical protein CYMTET_41674, partial [Cymbomonas tetramitiformis]
VVEHLGLEVDLKLGQFRVTERRVQKIEVFWEDDDCFYPGVVKEFNKDGKAHVLYDDGDEETLDLSKENFKIIGSSTVSVTANGAVDTDNENVDSGGNYKMNKRGGAAELAVEDETIETPRTWLPVGHGAEGELEDEVYTIRTWLLARHVSAVHA